MLAQKPSPVDAPLHACEVASVLQSRSNGAQILIELRKPMLGVFVSTRHPRESEPERVFGAILALLQFHEHHVARWPGHRYGPHSANSRAGPLRHSLCRAHRLGVDSSRGWCGCHQVQLELKRCPVHPSQVRLALSSSP
jgi:hypothetical protein